MSQRPNTLTGQTQHGVDLAFELWTIGIDGSNPKLVIAGPLLKLAVSYGGETSIEWHTASEIVFESYATIPPRKLITYPYSIYSVAKTWQRIEA